MEMVLFCVMWSGKLSVARRQIKSPGKESKLTVQLSESRWFCIADPEEEGLWS